MKTVIFVSALLAASAAMAQDLEFSPSATETCLSTVRGGLEQQVCIGLSAAACINTPDGYSTAGTAACYGKELDYWDGRLNAAYADLRAVEQTADEEMAELGSAAPKMAPALQDMQRAWIPYRDATCFYEVTQRGGGSGAGPASTECVMRLTALQALALEARLEEKQAFE